MRIKNFLNFSANLIPVILTSFSFVYALTDSMNLLFSGWKIALIILLFTLILSVVFLNKKSLTVTALFLGMVLVPALIYFIASRKLFILLHNMQAYITWVTNYLKGYESLVDSYGHTTVLLLVLSITIPVFILALKRFNFYLLLVSGLSIFVSQWLFDYFTSYVAFYLFTASVILLYFKKIFLKNSRTNKDECIKPGTFTLLSLPVCLIVLTVSILAPASDRPIQWPWMDRNVNDLYNFIRNKIYFQEDYYFSVASTGFGSGNKRLGGKVSLDNTVVMEVESSENVYLRGSCRDFYTGYSWENSENIYLPEEGKNTLSQEVLPQIDAALLYTAKSLMDNGRFGKDAIEEYASSENIRITFKNIKKKSIFIPIKTIDVGFKNHKPENLLYDLNGNFTSEDVLEDDFTYFADAFIIKNNEYLKKLLNRSKIGFYNNTPLKNSPLLNKYHDLIYSVYLQLPEKLPERVKNLAFSITSSKSSNYEKVMSIEQYLSNNYPYTLAPKKTPRSRDFVDYFLFDLKEGYCTYYASAMTVLVRSIGIPARYVEGFVLPPSPESGDIYMVTNQQAHAWVEVYLEGFGWMPFEPTAPFISRFYHTQPTGSFSRDFQDSPYFDDYMEMMEAYGNTVTIVPEIDRPDSSNATEYSSNKPLALFYISGASILFFLLILAINLLKRKLFLAAAKKKSPREAILQLYNYYVKILSLQKLKINPGETPTEYAERVNILMTFSRLKFSSVTEKFIIARYSNLNVSCENKQHVYDFYSYLISKTKSNMGRLRYFIIAEILGRV